MALALRSDVYLCSSPPGISHRARSIWTRNSPDRRLARRKEVSQNAIESRSIFPRRRGYNSAAIGALKLQNIGRDPVRTRTGRKKLTRARLAPREADEAGNPGAKQGKCRGFRNGRRRDLDKHVLVVAQSFDIERARDAVFHTQPEGSERAPRSVGEDGKMLVIGIAGSI